MRGRLALLLLALACVALQVQPGTVTIEGGPGTEFSHVFTVTSDQPRPLTIAIAPHQFSTYLAEAASLSTQRLTLEPFGSANLQVRGTIPVLGPETHRLTYMLVEDDEELSNLTIEMPITGSPTLHPKIDLDVEDAIANGPVTAEATLYNFGNVIAYYALEMLIRADGKTIGSLAYPHVVQVLPGAEEPLTLLYTDALEPGSYDLTLTAMVNGKEHVEARSPFRVVIAEERMSIHEGEDLVLSIDGEGGSVTYALTRDGEEVLRDTQRAQDEITVPTAGLPPGDYALEVRVQHSRGTDTTRLDLTIRRRGLDATTLSLLLATILLGGLFSIRPVRLLVRALHVQWRIRRTERALNRLVARAHRLSETP